MKPNSFIPQIASELWVDSLNPNVVKEGLSRGATGVTSNPVVALKEINRKLIIGEWQYSDYCDIENSSCIAVDALVTEIESLLTMIFKRTSGEQGYVCYQVSPQIEIDPQFKSAKSRVVAYMDSAIHCHAGRNNRMIKVPATTAGIRAIEEMVAVGIPVMATLMFTWEQYVAYRAAVLRGMKRSSHTLPCNSACAVFVSRLDSALLELGARRIPGPTPAVLNARRIWQDNYEFWRQNGAVSKHKVLFTSIRPKNRDSSSDSYLRQLTGSGFLLDEIDSVFQSTSEYPGNQVSQVVEETYSIDDKKIVEELLSDGIRKFCSAEQVLTNLLQFRPG